MSTLLTGVDGGAYVGTATAPSPGELVTASSVQIVAQAILDDAAFMNAKKAALAGADFTGAVTFDNVTTFNDEADFNSDVALSNSTTVTSGASTVIELLGPTRRRLSVYPTDQDHTYGASNGTIFILPADPLANRTITLRQTTAPVAVPGDWLRFVAMPITTGFTWTFKREGSAGIVAVITNTTNGIVELEVQVNGSNLWRVAGGSGFSVGADF